MKRLIYTLCILVSCLCTSEAKIPTERKIRLTDNWLYLRGDIGNIWEAVRPAIPQQPDCLTASQRLALSVITGGFTSGDTSCSPSVSISTILHTFPPAVSSSDIAATVPDTDE